MLFESECAFFMSAAAAAVSTATAAASEMTDPTNRLNMSSSPFSKDVTFSNGFFDIEQPHLLVPLTLKQTDFNLDPQPKQTTAQQDTQPQLQQQEQVQQQHQQQQQLQKSSTLTKITLQRPMEVELQQQHLNNDQSPVGKPVAQELQNASNDQHEQKPAKKKSISKQKQRSAEELSTCSQMAVDSDHPKSASAPEATTKSKATSTKTKSTANGAEPKKISPKTRKASLSSIIYRQLMAAGGLGLGVGIDKTVPIPARQRPPVRKSQTASMTEATVVKKSSTSSKANSSDSSGDPMPEHFGSAIGES
ncbi:uncharacterized protein DDB_G0285291-like [Anopheles marshallii]|uniref:uncharacterized protein DDB_G0285291-like n=1 Tax=Anopheles marshallii TaxID=1521116 RepID=UPI00237AA2F1|nr:uncharacterized protein DDB_G0285291-like [Anopheles marshallii]